MVKSVPIGRLLLQDPGAESASSDLPAFIARPAGAPVYHGFPLLLDSQKDGFTFGVISSPDGTEPVEWGDAYVVAPDGSRAGIVWQAGEGKTYILSAPGPGRWGVYGFYFSRPVHCERDLIENLDAVLPEIKAFYETIVRESSGK